MKLFNYSLLLLVCFTTIVVAPPPLEIELKAEKEESKRNQKTDVYIEYDTTGKGKDNEIVGQVDKEVNSLSIDEGGLPEGVRIIEDPREIKSLSEQNKVDGGEIVEEFHRIELPTSFNEYDVNSDGYIDFHELVDTTQAKENAKSAFDDSDIDGDGKISRTEFGYWFPDGTTIDISDELNNYSSDEEEEVTSDDESDDTDDRKNYESDEQDDKDYDDEAGKEEVESTDIDEDDDDDDDDENENFKLDSDDHLDIIDKTDTKYERSENRVPQ